MQYVPIFWDIETTGLHPMAKHWWNHHDHSARVVCVGVGYIDNYVPSNAEQSYTVDVLWDDNEWELLGQVADHMEELVDRIESFDEDYETFMVGWNSRGFDHPYYGARCARLRKDNFPFGHQRKRLDMMNAMKSVRGTRKNISQDSVAEEIGVLAEDEFDGSDMPELFEQGQIDPILHHCKTDLEDMVEIFFEYQSEMMNHFYDHYEIDADASYVDTVDL